MRAVYEATALSVFAGHATTPTCRYGKEVKIKAEPEFPSDYLHVQLQTGSGTGAGFADLAPFVVENRGALGESQDLAALHKRFNGPGSLMLKCMDLHVM